MPSQMRTLGSAIAGWGSRLTRRRRTWRTNLWLSLVGVTIAAIVASVLVVVFVSPPPGKATIDLATLLGAGQRHAGNGAHVSTSKSKKASATTAHSAAATPARAATAPRPAASPAPKSRSVSPLVIQQAAQSTLASGSAQVTIASQFSSGVGSFAMPGPKGPGSAAPSLPSAFAAPLFSGSLDFTTSEGDIGSYTLPKASTSPSSSAPATPLPPGFKMPTGGPPDPFSAPTGPTTASNPAGLRVVVTSTSLYLSTGVGGKWEELQSSGASASGTTGATDQVMFELYDPQMWLGLLAGAASPTTVIGGTSVGSTPATEYQTTIPAPFQAPGAGQLMLTADVWIDAQGRLVQLSVPPDPSTSAAVGAAIPSGIVDSFSQFGLPVSVTLPPGNAVVPLPAGP